MDFSSLRMPRASMHQLQALKGRHREIIRMHYLGLSRKDIALHFGMSEAAITNILQSDLAKEHLSFLQENTDADCIDARRRLEHLQHSAIDIYEKVLNGDIIEASVSQKMRAAAEVLDRGGLPRLTRTETRSEGAYLLRVGVEELMSRGRELGIIDTQPSLP